MYVIHYSNLHLERIQSFPLQVPFSQNWERRREGILDVTQTITAIV